MHTEALAVDAIHKAALTALYNKHVEIILHTRSCAGTKSLSIGLERCLYSLYLSIVSTDTKAQAIVARHKTGLNALFLCIVHVLSLARSCARTKS